MAETNERVILKRGKAATIPQAKEAGSILIETDTGVAYVDNSSTDRVQLKDPTKLPLEGGTMTGDIDMGDNNITTTHEPEDDDDVVTKKYVESFDKYSGIKPIEINGNEISHKEYGSFSGGPVDDTYPDYTESFTVPRISSDEFGHVTDITNKKITIPDIPDTVNHALQADAADELSTSYAIDGVLFNSTKDIAHYGTCSTASGTQLKVVSCEDFKLTTGSIVYVKFEHTNIADNPMLNVNGTGVKEIQFSDESMTTFEFTENTIYAFMYTGEAYEVITDSLAEIYGEYKVGPAADVTIYSGDTINVPYFTTDKYGNVKEAVDREIKFGDGSSGGGGGTNYYAVCTSESGLRVKTVECDDFELATGVLIQIEFQNGSSVTSPVLNINETGNVPITYQGQELDSYVIAKGLTYTFVYNGTSYEIVASPLHRQDEVDDDKNEFRNITILESDESETSIDAPVGSIILKKQPNGLSKVYWGTCTTASSTSTKMVACDGFKLEDGAMISIKFTNSNSSDSPSLNVDGTGAYPIYSQGSVISTSTIVSNVSYTFVYHDGVYDLVSGGADLTEAINDIYGKLSTTVSMDSTYYDTGGISTTDMQQEITELKEMITTLQTTLESYRDLLYMEVDD